MDGPKSVIATFNTPSDTYSYASIILDSGGGPNVATFTSLDSSNIQVFANPIEDVEPAVITQIQGKSIIVIYNNSGGGGPNPIYTFNFNNGAYTSVGQVPLPSNAAYVNSFIQINNGKFIWVTISFDQSSTTTYQSDSLTGQWTQLPNIPNNIYRISQSKDGNTIYYLSTDGKVFTSSNITDATTTWIGPITLTLSDILAGTIEAFVLTQLSDGSFVVVSVDNALYRTKTFPNRWNSVNQSAKFVTVAEIIN